MIDDNTSPEEKSKSQLKREASALQELGEALVKLNASQFKTMPLPEHLRAAIVAARAITEHGAHKRQLQYIGKLMRDVDPAPIQKALDAFNNRSQQATTQFHQLERWRDRLLSEGDTALSEFLTEYPGADSQQIRQLLRNAAREVKVNKPPAAARALFRYLREVSAVDGVEEEENQ